MSNLKGCFSHKTDDWRTPTKLYDFFMKKGFVDCFEFQSSSNQLEKFYVGRKLFINPPYSIMKDILFWLRVNIRSNEIVALLVPARTDTKWFSQLCVENQPFILFIEGRLKFNESKFGAPFPSVLMLFNIGHESNYLTIKYNDLFNLLDYLL